MEKVEEFLTDICPGHTDKSKWNKNQLLCILKLYEKHLLVDSVRDEDGNVKTALALLAGLAIGFVFGLLF